MTFFQFTGVGQGTITDRVPKLRGGFSGLVRITRLEMKNTRQEGPKFFVEFDVVSGGYVGSSGRPAEDLTGKHFSWGQSMMKVDVAQNNLKRWFIAASGIKRDDEANINAWSQPIAPGSPISHMDQALQTAITTPDQNSFVGRVMALETADAEGQQTKRPYVAHYFDAYLGG